MSDFKPIGLTFVNTFVLKIQISSITNTVSWVVGLTVPNSVHLVSKQFICLHVFPYVYVWANKCYLIYQNNYLSMTIIIGGNTLNPKASYRNSTPLTSTKYFCVFIVIVIVIVLWLYFIWIWQGVWIHRNQQSCSCLRNC